MPDISGPFAAVRLDDVHDQQVLQARMEPHVTVGDPDLRDWLRRWPGRRYVHEGPEGVEVMLTRRIRPRPRERWWLHLLLLALTLLSATVAGAFLDPGDPLLVRAGSLGGYAIPVPTRWSPRALVPGLWFSVPLLCILGAHESGHWGFARRHGMDASPPYFLPAPWVLSPIGTFGAFIRLRSPLLNRAALLDMGGAGPVVSFVLSVPALLMGLGLSRTSPTPPPGAGGARIGLLFPDGVLPLGESLLVAGLRMVSPVGDAAFVALHPLALAGWFGLFFTALNLFPISQLDGGHVMYAISPRLHRIGSVLTLVLLLAMGARWPGWWFWAGVILLVGRGRIWHPPVFAPAFPLDTPRVVGAWACMAMFVVAWVPVPFPL